MSEIELQERGKEWYQGYTSGHPDVAGSFRRKYGYPPRKIILTGSCILAGPIEECHEEHTD